MAATKRAGSTSPDEVGGGAGRAPAPRRDLEGELARLPDVRDGLTRIERVILVCLEQCQRERRGRDVSTAMLYGRVIEHVSISVPEFQVTLQRLVGVK